MQRSPVIPASFSEWRHCIEKECGIPLTEGYIAERLALLSNTNSEEASRFRTLYGEDHWRSVIGWFEQARTSRRPA
jgi:hypothetical protein